MGGMNPFGPSEIHPSPPHSTPLRSAQGRLLARTELNETMNTRGGVESPPDKGDGRGLNVVLETRRSVLKPEVRKYADKLYAEIKSLYASYDVKDAVDLYDKAKAGGVKVPKEDAKRLLRLQTELETALMRNELPIEKFPPYEAFRKMVDEINQHATPEIVTALDRWEEYELIDGKLNGKIKVGEQWYPIINGKLVQQVGGHEIFGCDGIHNVGGELNGVIGVSGRSSLPVINGELVEEIDGHKIETCRDIRNVNGELNGEVCVGEEWLPVIDGKLIREIDGLKISSSNDARNVDGKLNGSVWYGGRRYAVINGKMIRTIDGWPYQNIRDVRNVDGKLNACVNFHGKVWQPVIADQRISEIGGSEITHCDNIRNVDGKLNGRIIFIDGRDLPIINGEIIEKIEGQSIGVCGGIRNINGKLNGVAQIGDRILPVIAGESVKKIGGTDLIGIAIERQDTASQFSDAGGVFSGKVAVHKPDGTWGIQRVVLGEFVD